VDYHIESVSREIGDWALEVVEVKKMSQEVFAKEGTQAKAAILFCQKTYAVFPGAGVEAIDQHYSDKELTLEISVPEGTDLRQASDALLRIALEVENQYGVTIVTRAVREKGAST
jgi:hypothetical protein